MTESEWSGADFADRHQKVDAFQEALHDLTTEAIAEGLPARFVISSLQTETYRQQHQLYSLFNKGRS